MRLKDKVTLITGGASTEETDLQATAEQAIADAIVDFFRNGRSIEFRKNVQSEKKRFTWDAMSKQIIELADRYKLTN